MKNKVSVCCRFIASNLIQLCFFIAYLALLQSCSTLSNSVKKNLPIQGNMSQEQNDSLAILALDNLRTNSDFMAANEYLEKTRISNEVRRKYMHFFLDGANSPIDAKRYYSKLFFKNNVTREDLDEATIERLLETFDSDLLYTDILYSIVAKFELEPLIEVLKTKFADKPYRLLYQGEAEGEVEDEELRYTERKYWNAARALASTGDTEATHYLLQTTQQWLELDREFAYTWLAGSLIQLKVKAITQLIIDEFILSTRCYDTGDPGLAPRYETDLAYGLAVIKEYKAYEDGYRRKGTILRQVDIREWFKRNRTTWTFVETE